MPRYLLMGGALLLALVTSIYGLNRLGKSRAGPPVTANAGDDTTMVRIPAGTYLMGSGARGVAAPQHTDSIAAFRIDKHEVTVGDYSDFVTAGLALPPWGSTMPDLSLPVTRVGWGEARSYCAWKHKDGGRLPTEQEWEAAARGAAGATYPWGNALKRGAANVASAGRNGPVAVGSFARGATANGIHDLVGNVWEWTSSPMRAYPGGTPLADSLANYRVIRGGAFHTPDEIATAWLRGYSRPATAPEELQSTGFRCAK